MHLSRLAILESLQSCREARDAPVFQCSGIIFFPISFNNSPFVSAATKQISAKHCKSWSGWLGKPTYISAISRINNLIPLWWWSPLQVNSEQNNQAPQCCPYHFGIYVIPLRCNLGIESAHWVHNPWTLALSFPLPPKLPHANWSSSSVSSPVWPEGPQAPWLRLVNLELARMAKCTIQCSVQYAHSIVQSNPWEKSPSPHFVCQ